MSKGGVMVMGRTADISDCGKFRWRLGRRWDDGPRVCFVMLNPSTADADVDDPTIRRCIGFAKLWGCGSLSVVNLYPYRATKPSDLKKAMKTVDVSGGGRGTCALQTACMDDLVIAAWGVHATETAERRFLDCTKMPVWCLEKTKDGRPAHPLFLKSHLCPEPFARCDGLNWRDALAMTTNKETADEQRKTK